MGEPGFDDHTQPFGRAPAPPPGYGHEHGAAPRAQGEPWQGGGGPLGDWLHEAGAAWAAGPPSVAPGAAPGVASGYAGGAFARPQPPPAPWIAPPQLDDEPRSRWSLTGAAPWVVAGLLCAVLLTGRDTPAAPAATGLPVDITAAEPLPPEPGGAGAAPAPVPAQAPVSCAGVTP